MSSCQENVKGYVLYDWLIIFFKMSWGIPVLDYMNRSVDTSLTAEAGILSLPPDASDDNQPSCPLIMRWRNKGLFHGRKAQSLPLLLAVHNRMCSGLGWVQSSWENFFWLVKNDSIICPYWFPGLPIAIFLQVRSREGERTGEGGFEILLTFTDQKKCSQLY
jgi:hypothetical protein